jgi:hypothetical protein
MEHREGASRREKEREREREGQGENVTSFFNDVPGGRSSLLPNAM